jgi:hypothetical protein
VRSEFANRKLAAERQGLDAPTIAQLEKIFVTNATFHKEIGTLRAEIGEVRSEMHTELGALRSEMRTESGAVRLEIHTQVGALGSAVHAELAALRTEMARIPFETIKWFFTLSGIIAAICFGALRLT